MKKKAVLEYYAPKPRHISIEQDGDELKIGVTISSFSIVYKRDGVFLMSKDKKYYLDISDENTVTLYEKEKK
jgi:hypothetical protein